ncbi:MarR Transcriptional regulators [Methylophilaceae bacterium]
MVLILLMCAELVTSTPSVLAEKLGVSRATMTGLLDGLEKSRLVTRVFAKEDRRSVKIQLTVAGQAKLDVVMPDYYCRLKLCMQGLDEDKRLQLQQLLGLINMGIPALI